jgi:hypothetical protein
MEKHFCPSALAQPEEDAALSLADAAEVESPATLAEELELVWANAFGTANPASAVPIASTADKIARVLIVLFMAAYEREWLVYM